MYCTGDRVRCYADDELEFSGRIDLQVKLARATIELGKIEHVLRAQPGVDEAVVLLDARLNALVAHVSQPPPSSTLAWPLRAAVMCNAALGALPCLIHVAYSHSTDAHSDCCCSQAAFMILHFSSLFFGSKMTV